MNQKVEGVVLKSIPYGETHKILTILTRQLGKIGVIARGASKPRSKFTACAQPFTYGDFLIHRRKGLGTLHQASVTESMRMIREDIIEKTAYAAVVLELTDKVIEEGSGSSYIYNLLYKTLKHINDGKDAEVMMYIYLMKLLDFIGIRPYLDSCQCCGGTQGKFQFSILRAGFLCNGCSNQDQYGIKISTPTVKVLRALQYVDVNRIENISVKMQTKEEVRKVLIQYYEEYSGIYLKSIKFVNQLNLLSAVK